MSTHRSSRTPSFFAQSWKLFRADFTALDHALVHAMIGARWGQRTFIQFRPNGAWNFYQAPAGHYCFDADSIYLYVPACPDHVHGPVKAGYLDRHPKQALAAIALIDAAAKYVLGHPHVRESAGYLAVRAADPSLVYEASLNVPA
jgi:hypothetical protein